MQEEDDSEEYETDKSSIVLSNEEREEFENLHKALSKIINEENSFIDEKKVKEKLANFSLKLVYPTNVNKEAIKETCYVLSSFLRYRFNDSLDDVFMTASELDMPGAERKNNFLKIWNGLKKNLEIYLNDY